jgi:predicted DNA-binding transcriptional regulator YafY
MSNVGPEDPDSRGGDYRIPEDFDPEIYLSGRFESLSGTDPHTVRLRVGPDQAPYFQSKAYHRTQLIEREEASGHLVVSYDVVGLKEIRSFVRSWGAGVEVLSPPELREEIKREAENVQAMYE